MESTEMSMYSTLSCGWFWRRWLVSKEFEAKRAGSLTTKIKTLKEVSKAESDTNKLEHKARFTMKAALEAFGIGLRQGKKLTSVDTYWYVNRDTHAGLAAKVF